MKGFGLGSLLFGMTMVASGEELTIPLVSKGTHTYYIQGEIKGVDSSSFLVDTGSGYSVISRQTLNRLEKTNSAVYARKLEGIMADGSSMVVPVYRISGITLGNNCFIPEIEAAVFPASNRQILGLNALRKVAPFSFSFEPPSLVLSNCTLVENKHIKISSQFENRVNNTSAVPLASLTTSSKE